MAMLKIPTVAKYRKRVHKFGAPNVKHDESVLDFSTAKSCYNFDFTSGALKSGYGIAEHSAVPNDARRYWVYRYYSDDDGAFVDQYLYQQESGHLRYYDNVQKRVKYVAITVFDPMDAINYRLNSKDVLLMSCKGRGLMVWDGKRFTEYESPSITSMALHYERLFVTSRDQPSKIFFSDDLDPTNWNTGDDAGGFIELLDERGELNKVVSFGNYLYIFRDHGISRVTAYGDQSEFSVVGLFVSAGRIYPSSISKCGSCIMFLASDGLYMFDGYDCARRLTNLDGLIAPSDGCAAAFSAGKYYLACRMDFNDGREIGCEADEHNNNALLIYDVTTGEFSISRGVDISALNACSYNGEDFLFACDDGRGGVIARCGARFDESLPKHWQGPATDFGMPDKTKTVREVYADGDCDYTVTVQNEKRAKTASVAAGAKRMRMNMSCKKLSLSVDCDAVDCTIKSPTVVYSIR